MGQIFCSPEEVFINYYRTPVRLSVYEKITITHRGVHALIRLNQLFVEPQLFRYNFFSIHFVSNPAGSVMMFKYVPLKANKDTQSSCTPWQYSIRIGTRPSSDSSSPTFGLSRPMFYHHALPRRRSFRTRALEGIASTTEDNSQI